jgi:DNA-binding IclR family transcriptional regulator
MSKEARHPVRTTETSFEIIDKMRGNEVWGVTELANHLDIGKSSVHNHLSTMAEHGYVVKMDEGYRLSFKFLDIGDEIRKDHPLFEVAEPEVQSLADKTGEIGNFMIEENGQGVYLIQSTGENAVSITKEGLGTSVPLHATALGKAILAHQPNERIEEIIDTHGLGTLTGRTITDSEVLYERLDTIRDRGYALDKEERLEGLRCVAAPVINSDDIAIGAISISAPTTRVTDEEIESDYSKLVRESANVIEIEVRH